MLGFSFPRLFFSFFHFKLPLSFLWSLEFISLLTAAKTTLRFALLIGCQTRCFWKGDPILEVPRASLNCLFVGRCRSVFSSPHMQYHLLSGLYLDGARPAEREPIRLALPFYCFFSSHHLVRIWVPCLLSLALPAPRHVWGGGGYHLLVRARVFYDIWAGRNLRCGMQSLVGRPGSEGAINPNPER